MFIRTIGLILALILFVNFETVPDIINNKNHINNTLNNNHILSEIDILCKMNNKQKLNYKEKQLLKILTLNLIKDKCDSLEIDYKIVVRLVQQESRFNYLAESKTGAEGLMQFTDITLRDYPHNVYNYKETIHNGVLYLVTLRNRFMKRNLDRETSNILAVASYNCGFSRVLNDSLFITKPETREYIKIIFNEETLDRFTRK